MGKKQEWKAFRVIERRIRGVLASKDSGRLESWPRRHIIEKEHSVTQAFLPELPVEVAQVRVLRSRRPCTRR